VDAPGLKTAILVLDRMISSQGTGYAQIYAPLSSGYHVFRYLGGAQEPGGLLRALQGFVYGLTPAVFGGFLPWFGLAMGVYTTVLQLQRGPAITLKNRTIFAYLPVIAVLTYAIARYWSGALL
jgi:hypothetical protein